MIPLKRRARPSWEAPPYSTDNGVRTPSASDGCFKLYCPKGCGQLLVASCKAYPIGGEWPKWACTGCASEARVSRAKCAQRPLQL
eukprot:4679602-Alexandrium_andersonii.AAC.1